MRPMAMFSKEQFMKPETVTKIMALHVMEDYKKHPEYFVGVDIDEALISIVKDYPNLLDELFGRD